MESGRLEACFCDSVLRVCRFGGKKQCGSCSWQLYLAFFEMLRGLFGLSLVRARARRGSVALLKLCSLCAETYAHIRIMRHEGLSIQGQYCSTVESMILGDQISIPPAAPIFSSSRLHPERRSVTPCRFLQSFCHSRMHILDQGTECTRTQMY